MCDFCQKRKFIKFSEVGEGIKTMQTNLALLFGRKNDKERTDCIFLDDDNSLGCDTSSGEYAPQFVEINFCPFCGRELLKNE